MFSLVLRLFNLDILHIFVKPNILKIFANLSNAKPMVTHMSLGTILSISNGTPLEDPTLYHNLVSALQCCIITQYNITYMITKLC